MVNNPGLAPQVTSSRMLYIYEGRMRGVGCDLDVRHHLQALGEAGIGVDFLARGTVDFPGVRCLKTRLLPAKIFSSMPALVYNGARRRYLGHLGVQQFRRHPYSMVMAWAQSALALFVEAAKRGVPRVLHYGNLHLDHGGNRKPDAPWPRIGGSRMREEIELANWVVVPSEFCRQSFLEAGVAATKVVVSHRGADLSRFRSTEPSQDVFRVICLGRVCARKGAAQLVAAWRKAGLQHAELWFVGGVDSDCQELVRSCEDDPSIRFHGFTNEPERFLCQCDVSVLLSENEGLAKTLIESAACSLAILCTKESGYPLDDGLGGYWVARSDSQGVADLLARLYARRDLCRRMGAHNREQVLREFTWEQSRRHFVSLCHAWLNAPESAG